MIIQSLLYYEHVIPRQTQNNFARGSVWTIGNISGRTRCKTGCRIKNKHFYRRRALDKWSHGGGTWNESRWRYTEHNWTDIYVFDIWTASSEFGTYRLCEQRRFRRTCASAQSRQNLRCSLIQAVSQEEPSDRKPDPWPLWMAGHAQLKSVMTECWKTQIRLAGLIWGWRN